MKNTSREVKLRGDDADQTNSLEGGLESPFTSHASSKIRKREQQQLKTWLPFACGALVFFGACNSTLSMMTDNSGGIESLFYCSTGGVFVGIVFTITNSIRHKCENPEEHSCWFPLNIIKDGKFSCKHFLIQLLAILLYIGTNTSIVFTMYFSNLAKVNTGIILALWGMQPFLAGTMDYILNGERLTFFHFVGITFVVAGGVCVSLNSNTLVVDDGYQERVVPKWVAVVFAIITPCFFITQGLFLKHVTQPRIGFHPQTISATASFVGSLIMLIIALTVFWPRFPPVSRLLWIGFLASILDTIGKICIHSAYSKGPAGPVAAFVEMNNVFVVLIEAFRTQRVPKVLEFVGFFLVIIGAFVLIAPNKFQHIMKGKKQ